MAFKLKIILCTISTYCCCNPCRNEPDRATLAFYIKEGVLGYELVLLLAFRVKEVAQEKSL